MYNYTTEQLKDLDQKHYLHPFTDYKKLSQEGSRIITRADGVYLWDSDGNRFLDAMAGLWCVNVGYGRSEIADAVREQMLELPYYNSFFKTPNTASRFRHSMLKVIFELITATWTSKRTRLKALRC